MDATATSTLPPQHVPHAETVAALRARADEERTPPQRLVEAFSAGAGRPRTLGALGVLVACWLAWNTATPRDRAVDPPPFFWLQGAVSLYAAFVGTVVLATQNREKRHAERRAYFELQVNLLAEQKTAKIIELLEELRRDLPSVPDRRDKQADALQEPLDAEAVLHTLQEVAQDDGEPA